MTSCASSTGPMPLPIGWRPSVVITSTDDAEMIADELEQLSQPHRLHGVRKLGCRADRKIDQQMRRARGELLRHDRGDHLLARIEAERPLDRNENVVGRRQIHMPAPDQAAVTRRDDLLHLVDPEVDPRQHLHGVRGAGRGGDRARRGLGNRQSVRRHDRHHDHRRAIARNSADAMLVDDDRPVPFELRSRLSHRVGQGEKLVARHEARGTDQERGDLHVGIAIMREVIDDGADFRGAQRAALDLGAHRIEAVGRSGRRDRHEAAGGLGEATERRFGKAEIVGADQSVVIRDKQGCQQHLGIATQFDTAETAKDLRPQRLGPARDHGHVFAAGIQIDTADLQLRTQRIGGVHIVRSMGKTVKKHNIPLPEPH